LGHDESHLAEALAQEGHRVKLFERAHLDRLSLEWLRAAR